MIYLLAKYALLFLLTTLLGFVLGYWFSRRKFVDVSESYEELRKANERSDTTQWDRLWKHLDAIPEPVETDLSGVYERLDGVAKTVANLPKPEPVSFASVDSRLDSLKETVRNIPTPLRPKDPDLRPVIERLDWIERSIKAIPMPEKPAPVDLTPVTGKLDKLEQVVRNIPIPRPQRDVDLKPVQSELTLLRSAIKDIPSVETHEPVDLTPVTSQLSALEQRFSAMTRPQNVDLAPFDRRLKAIETELSGLGKRLPKPTGATRSARAARPARAAKASRKEPRILSAALYGKKDDLKLISGVGPKLEKLLNHNGVFYFWQVAEWSPSDIDVIDERLDAFKGRIARDNWVSQAKELRRQPDAARMPAE